MTGDNLQRDMAEFEVAVAGIAPELIEGNVHAHPRVFGKDSFGLLDRNAAVKCSLELLGQQGCVPRVLLCKMPIVATSASAWAVCSRLRDSSMGTV